MAPAARVCCEVGLAVAEVGGLVTPWSRTMVVEQALSPAPQISGYWPGKTP